MHWVYLVISGLLEIGWAISLKKTEGFTRLVPVLFYAGFGLGAALCLSRAMRVIPLGVAYTSWVGIAAVGTLLVDFFWFKQPTSPLKFVCMALIVIGVSGLKVASAAEPHGG